MARGRRRPTLYDVIKRTRFKSSYGKRLRPPPSAGGEIPAESAPGSEARPFVWPRRPRFFQLSGDKVEISVPYQIAVAVVLGIIVLILLAFRLGQWNARKQQGIVPSGEKAQSQVETGVAAPPALTGAENAAEVLTGPRLEEARLSRQGGDHQIVIQQYQIRADLVPVQKHFADYGIGTEIQQRDDVYFLVTKELYENPEKKGTDGYEAKQRIIEVGSRYRAQSGYETFAPHLFGDAYGERVR